MPNPYATKETESYKETILRALNENRERWFYNYELREFSLSGRWVGSSGDRRCRELAEEGLIAVRYVGKFVLYGHLDNQCCVFCGRDEHAECEVIDCACKCPGLPIQEEDYQ